MVEIDNVFHQKIMETIINILRKNCRPDTDSIYKELTKDCASNLDADDIERQTKLIIDNGLLENRLGFSPSLANRSQVNFSVETPKICKQIDQTPEIFG